MKPLKPAIPHLSHSLKGGFFNFPQPKIGAYCYRLTFVNLFSSVIESQVADHYPQLVPYFYLRLIFLYIVLLPSPFIVTTCFSDSIEVIINRTITIVMFFEQGSLSISKSKGKKQALNNRCGLMVGSWQRQQTNNTTSNEYE